MVKKKTSTKSVKKTTKKRTAPKQQAFQSFKLAKEPRPFLSVAVTDDTLHWVIIGAAVVCFGLMVSTMQIQLYELFFS